MQTSNLFQPALVPRQKDVFLQVPGSHTGELNANAEDLASMIFHH